MKKLYFLLLTILAYSFSFGQDPVINEVDADTPGSDTAEFIEIFWTPSTALDGYVVVLFNGSTDLSYYAIDLDGYSTDSNGFFMIGSTGMGTEIEISPGGSGWLQNGADAVALYLDDATSFPTDTPVTSTNLIDALVYDTADADDSGLLMGLGETIQYDESVNGASATESVQRKMDGTYETKTPTPRASNDAAVCELSLTTTSATCDALTSGTDTYTATVNFVGGGTSTYSVMADSGVVDLSGGDPDVDASGTITVTGVSEGTDVTITVTGGGGLCDLMSTVTSPTCIPIDALPIFEDFDYGGSAGDLTAVSGGKWANHSGTTTVLYATSSLSMGGYPSSGVGGSATITGANSEDVNRSFAVQSSGVVYFSALVSLSSVGTGDYFIHLKDAGSGFRARVAAKDDGGGKALFGIAASSTIVYGTTPFDLNTTYLVVASYNIDNGAANLYVLTSPAATEPLTPEATDSGTSGTLISAVALRQSTNIPTATIDGIQVGTSWASAVLSVENAQIDGFKFSPNPTSLGYVNITSKSQSVMTVSVYDILGKQVLSRTVENNRLDVSGLTPGIYIMKISQDDASTTKKLVIR